MAAHRWLKKRFSRQQLLSIARDRRPRLKVATEWRIHPESVSNIKRRLGYPPPSLKKHGEVKQVDGKRVASPEYRSWQSMKNRCLNPQGKDWKYYGGRGIKIAARWMNFEEFLADMGRRPSPLHSLERKNNNKHYEKRNCYWATKSQQSQNRTDTRFSLTKVKKIRALYATGRYRQKDLAKRFGSTQAAVSQITRGVAWKEVTQ